jgi:hypothetical protein
LPPGGGSGIGAGGTVTDGCAGWVVVVVVVVGSRRAGCVVVDAGFCAGETVVLD